MIVLHHSTVLSLCLSVLPYCNVWEAFLQRKRRKKNKEKSMPEKLLIFWHHPALIKKCQYKDSTLTLWFMLSSLVIFYNSDKIKMLIHDVVSHAVPP